MPSPVTSERIKTLAREVGFDLVGIAPATPSDDGAYYRDWLARGNAGEMAFLHRHVDLRLDCRTLLPGAQSVICVGVNYRRQDGHITSADSGVPGGEPTGRIAQYARGVDYHRVIREMLESLTARLRRESAESFDVRPCVDTAPVLERELAKRAGLGWIGKNTCLLNPVLGSYVLLGELITTLPLTPDEPIEERCRSCRRCLEACPTGALTAAGALDARRCIAYLTIEHKGEIPSELSGSMGNWVFGCDVCQQVCPYNAKAPAGAHPTVCSERVPSHVSLNWLKSLRSGDYKRLTAATALRRASRAMLRRNGSIARQNWEREGS